MSKRILVVDDSATMRDMLSQYLQAGDYLVACATSGAQALDILKTERFDVIVTDLEMPELDGFALIRSISELDWDPAVILFTQHDQRTLHSARELAMAYSVNLLGTLTKPIDKEQLLLTLNDVAKTRSSARQGTETVLAETEFMRGLMTDGLAPVFQPKVNLATGEVEGAEVFARWRAPGGGLLGANAVVRVAREKGYMDVLTYRMLELAMEQQGKWAREGQDIQLSINVSSENLRKEDFADVVSGLADQFGVDPKKVRLELAESEFQVDERVPLEVLSRLHLRGFGLTLDDFGTGFASLIRLHSIPFDELVVDREFIGRAAEDKIARTILESAIDLSHKLELRCSCEGIEDAAQLEMVKSLKADVGQGYHIAKPMAPDEFLIWIEDYKDGVEKIEGLN
ncbi:EAL domain-containing protein [Kordiimonas sp. SCSIO 12603]|uniref:EAL domain-containing response regulator n=1 Tax=Kordiimonas sp. SCSIO 12603 TaxID=2829596 RepID=UPI002105A864|nr:EAL domain-containing protein [Kordiimonas sp. SCSIO 12603]UTW58164.1 EAL domain-containing protein [Kordiimonas sp. SCSIO 12603]